MRRFLRRAGKPIVSPHHSRREELKVLGEKPMKKVLAIATIVILASNSAFADEIVGNWQTKSGETAAIAECGNGFCITLKTGKFSGRQIGTFDGEGGSYSGKITDPNSDKTYTGKARISGTTLKMSGCVMLGLLCRTEDWKRM
jgi:uncharacterized protein (DUF2147 family)